MSKADHCYLPHLALSETSLLPGAEWMPRLTGWALLQVAAGNGYWMGPRAIHELQTGSVLVLSADAAGNIRASHLGGLRLYFVPVDPGRLAGLFSLSEQRFFGAAAGKEELAVRIFPPDDLLAERMKGACAGASRGGTLFRVQLLGIFLEIFAADLKPEQAASTVARDARERLQQFLKNTPTAELLHISFAELAQMTRCTPRHLNRIFNEVVGMSFRDKHTELRLARACELLATTESKVVDVALESGYQSLSLFNLMFTRRFGISPGKWRRMYRDDKTGAVRRRDSKLLLLLPENGARRTATPRNVSQRVCV